MFAVKLAYDDVTYFVFPGELYVSDKQGSDQDGDGTEQKPFKTPLKVNETFCCLFNALSLDFFCSKSFMQLYRLHLSRVVG